MRAPRALGSAAAAALVFCAGIGMAHAGTSAEALPETMATLKHAIGIPTVEGQHQVPVLAAYLADQLKAGGDPLVLGSGEHRQQVVLRRRVGNWHPALSSLPPIVGRLRSTQPLAVARLYAGRASTRIT